MASHKSALKRIKQTIVRTERNRAHTTKLRHQIRKLRTAKSWSQEELGQISGLSARTVQRIETESSGSLDSRRALASAFGLTPEDLLAATSAIALGARKPAPASLFIGL